ncbi:hypothetical protein [Swingsia samuiensis]|uniref:Uncharacterized protein n=1 Tax=Swingsia samuiensis TaxID=1293412 RepID=A0A4Y6ULV4_9PROT|nr:hypothetical protein [Swingsia samuiensis]QDH17371.1 hypothetical protein E3D00_07205 [Swingsia samuiensis]
MSTVPHEDSEIFIMTLQQLNGLLAEDQKAMCPTNLASLRSQIASTQKSALPTGVAPNPMRDRINSVSPWSAVDSINETLKDNTYVDIFGWHDAFENGRSAIKQITILGIKGDAYLKVTSAGKKLVVFKGRPGLRAKLSGTTYLRDNPIIKELGLVIGESERLAEGATSRRMGIFGMVTMDLMHECLQDKFDMTSLGVTLLSDITQGLLATYLGETIGLMLVGASGPIVMSFCVIGAASFGVAWAFSVADRKFGLTDKAIDLAKNIEKSRPVESFVEYVEHLGLTCKNLIVHPGAYFSYKY